MYILTLKGKPEGVFSILDDIGEHVVPIWTNETDAERYYIMIEDLDYPPMQIVEIEDDIILGACEDREQKYAIITENDFLVPPEDFE